MRPPAQDRAPHRSVRVRQSTSGATTSRRAGSWPSLYVSTSWRVFRCSWTTLRSSALIASSDTGRRSWTAVSAAWSAGGPERDRAPLAVAGGVDHDPLADAGPVDGDPVGEVLDRVDRLAVVADQQTEVIAHEVGADVLVVLLDLHLASTPTPAAIGSSISRTREPASPISASTLYLLRPERFFFLRGGGGGVPPFAPRAPRRDTARVPRAWTGLESARTSAATAASGRTRSGPSRRAAADHRHRPCRPWPTPAPAPPPSPGGAPRRQRSGRGGSSDQSSHVYCWPIVQVFVVIQ